MNINRLFHRQLHKFGGSSLKNKECYRRVKKIILNYSNPGDIIVVSASGKTTDLLLNWVNNNQKKNIQEEIKIYHIKIINDLLEKNNSEIICLKFLKELKFISILLKNKINNQIYSKIIGYGEIWSARLMNAFLNQNNISSLWINSRKFLYASNGSQPEIDQKKSSKLLKKFIQNHNKRLIITGFICSNKEGNPHLLGRNGSDYSATQIGVLAKVSKITIWSDVSGVYTADPKKIKNTYLLSFLRLNEANELARLGSSVLHTRTLQPILKENINLELRSSYYPKQGCTIIQKNLSSKNLIITSHNNIIITYFKLKIISNFFKIYNKIIILLKINNHFPLIIDKYPEKGLLKFYYIQENHKYILNIIKMFESFGEINYKTGFGLIALVGSEVCQNILHMNIFQKYTQKLKVETIYKSKKNISIIAIVPINIVDSLEKNLHNAIFYVKKKIGLLLFGIGNIGSFWLKLFSRKKLELLFQTGYEVVLVGIVNSSHYFLDFNGIDPCLGINIFKEKSTPKNKKFLLRWIIKKNPYKNLIILDITDSKSLSKKYRLFAKLNFHVITANKISIGDSNTKNFYKIKNEFIKNKKYYLYNATVGAGLPINYIIKDLKKSGDSIFCIQGIFSGTLSWLFLQYDGTVPFSKLVYQAWKNGLTEPDPRVDLSGKDVVRKLVILIREAGYQIEPQDIKVESLTYQKSQSLPLDTYFKNENPLDIYIQKKYELAKKKGLALRYIAFFTVNKKAYIKLKPVSFDSPFYNLLPSDNIFYIKTLWYKNNPLIIRGPGAGKEVTSGAIQSDINHLLSLI